ncbi:hypothetical protein PSTT_08044 [Puccinia striiformis]|uniref:Uncharacterized protein n=1 Tax=Puccinia striiformis TaxID=27350 RepID=A0A2S4VE63_9BASI|nr:hypothetical protein PSTT_08044 [Puccinia striiformis]
MSKRRAENPEPLHPEPLWDDPNQLPIPRLRQTLSAFKIPIDHGELRTKLFRRYVFLARTQSPESVMGWLGLDSLDGPLPAPDTLVVSQIKILLALYGIDYPAQPKRAHLVELYLSIAPTRRPRIPASPATSATVSVVSVLIPSLPKRKKQKPNLRARSNQSPTPPKPLPKSNAPRVETLLTHVAKPGVQSLPSHVGKSKRIKSMTRSPRKATGPSRARSMARIYKSSKYALRRSPRLRAAQGHTPMLVDSEEGTARQTSPSSADLTQFSQNDARDKESQIVIKYDSDADSDMPSRSGDFTETAGSPTPSTVRPADSPINVAPAREASEDRRASEQPRQISPSSADLTQFSQNDARDEESQIVIKYDSDADSDMPTRSVAAPADDNQLRHSSQQTTQEEDPESQTASNPNQGTQSPIASVSPQGSEDLTASCVPESSLNGPADHDSQSQGSRRSSVPADDSDENQDSRSSQASSRRADQDSDQESGVSQRSSVPAGEFEASSSRQKSANRVSEADNQDSASCERASVSDETEISGVRIDSEPSSSPRSPRIPSNPTTSSPRPLPRPASSQKRKSKDASEWPEAHNVPYNPSTRLARMVGSYNTLRLSLTDLRELQPHKRSRVPPSSPPPTSSRRSSSSRRPSSSGLKRRRKRAKVGASSDNDQVGFVYRCASIPLPSPSESGSSARSSNYQPSVASIETSVATVSQTSISTRSTTRTKRKFPTQNAGQKQVKKSSPPLQTSTAAPKRRTQRSQPRRIGRRIRTHHAADDIINFVPILPETSKKRKNLSSTFAPVKRARPDCDDPPSELPTRPQASTSRLCRASTSRHRRPKETAQNSYTPQYSFRDDGVVHYSFRDDGEVNVEDVRPEPVHQSALELLGLPSKRTRPEPPSPPGLTKRPRPGPSDCDLPHSRLSPRPSTSHSRWKGKERAHENSYVPSSSFHERQPAFHDDDEALLPAAPRSKRKRPDDCSPSFDQAAKRQALSTHELLPTSPLLPCSPQVRRRRPREPRVRHNSFRGPSIHDDILVPNSPERGIERWRSSVPPDYSSPPPSPSPSPSHPPHTHSGRCHVGGSSCVGQRMVSDFVQATSRLTDCIEKLTTTKVVPLQQAPNRRAAAHDHLSFLTLFGRTMDLGLFPPPATDREKADWRPDPENDYSDDETASQASSDNAADEPDDNVPFFPYRDGPGHKNSLMSILKIMRRSMRRSGVVSFRPDFARGVRDTDNRFLWDLAHSIFVKLVRAQEYPEIDLETCSTTMIRQAIFNHAEELQRSYRQARLGSEALREKARKKRVQMRTTRLRDARAKFCSTQAFLIPFIPTITACTSDAESEDGDEGLDDEDHEDDEDLALDQRRVIVQTLEWRHDRIGEAARLIDQLIERKRKSGDKSFGRSSTIIRVRPHNPRISTRPCPQRLPVHAYSEEYIKTLGMGKITRLEAQSYPSLRGIVKGLSNMI